MDRHPTHGEPDQRTPERFWTDLDLDDVVESFLGSLAAGVLLLLVLWMLARRRHAKHVDHAA